MTTETAAPYTVETYATEAEWLAARRQSIGASDAAALLGLSPWKSPFALWAEKCGVERDLSDNPRLHWGRVLEGPIADRYHEVTGAKLEDLGRFTILRSVAWPWLTATLDRIIRDDERGPGLLEIKSVSEFAADEWETEPPLQYQTQVQVQYAVTGFAWAELAALFGGWRFERFPVARHDGIINVIVERSREFMERVQRREPPEVDASDATADVLAKLYPQETGTTVALSDESDAWHAERVDAAEQIKRYTEIKDAATNRLKAAIGEATFGTTPGGVRYKWATKHVKEFVVKEKSYRELRLVK